MARAVCGGAVWEQEPLFSLPPRQHGTWALNVRRGAGGGMGARGGATSSGVTCHGRSSDDRRSEEVEELEDGGGGRGGERRFRWLIGHEYRATGSCVSRSCVVLARRRRHRRGRRLVVRARLDDGNVIALERMIRTAVTGRRRLPSLSDFAARLRPSSSSGSSSRGGGGGGAGVARAASFRPGQGWAYGL